MSKTSCQVVSASHGSPVLSTCVNARIDSQCCMFGCALASVDNMAAPRSRRVQHGGEEPVFIQHAHGVTHQRPTSVSLMFIDGVLYFKRKKKHPLPNSLLCSKRILAYCSHLQFIRLCVFFVAQGPPS